MLAQSLKVLTLGVLVFVNLCAAQDSWPQFRGADGDGHAAADSSPPLTWDAKRNIAWRTELPGEGWSSPVIRKGKIYLTAAVQKDPGNETDFDLSLLIVDVDSGDLLKQVVLLQQTKERPPKMHKKNSHASPTAIVTADRVYVHFGYQGTVCTDLDGNTIWSNRELYFRPTHGNGGSPILVDDRLIFTCDGDKEPKVVALDAATGEVAWTTPRPLKAKKTFSFCTPALITVAGQKQVVVPGSDCVLALDPASGDVIWDVRYTGYSVVPKPIFANGRVFVSTSFDNASLLAIRPDGRGVVTDSHVDWEVDKNVSKTPSMIAHDGLIYLVSDNGVAQCLEADSGELVYRKG